MIYRRNAFDQPVKNDIKAYDNIWEITADQGDDYPTVCLLDYPYFKKQSPKLFSLKYRQECSNLFHYWKSEKKIVFFYFSQGTVRGL